MNTKTIGIGLIIIGTLGLIGYFLYKLFQEGDVPLFIKIAIIIILIGAVILIPKLIKEAKKDKVIVK